MSMINVGLIAGRHAMPVDEYIINCDVNPLDFEGIENLVFDWCAIHQNSDVAVYVTCLTAVTATVIYACEYFRINLTLMHYNKDTDGYVAQKIWAFKQCPFCGRRMHTQDYYCPSCGSN